ncbi:MAG: lytic murein transglycosylase B [Gammaproteobacteria bacterium]|nr:lytic murein transglycosylase B [Gammaproteobacteria bacterium]
MIPRTMKAVLIPALCTTLLCASAATAGIPSDFDQQVKAFAGRMTSKHDLDPVELNQLLSEIQYHQKIIDAISRPAEAKPWFKYRKIFVTKTRATEGVEFWNANRELLERAEQKHGVPAEIIVAIIGVETRYGRHGGSYPVIDALATLAFGYPKRSAFFSRELEQYLLLVGEEGLDPRTTKGSYAGAMGLPQFIPSSYRAYAVDFDGDGKRDLLKNKADAIGSVAAYLKRHGWQRGKPITYKAKGANSRHRAFVKAGMKPSLRIDKLAKAGIRPEKPLPGSSLSSLILLDGDKGKEYWLGLTNFYAITRYNHSNLYAMAVYQLSQKIVSLRATGGKK